MIRHYTGKPTDLEKEILYELARQGAANRYVLAKNLRRSISSVRWALKRLLAAGLIEIFREERAPTGHPKRIYRVSTRGLYFALEGVKSDRDLRTIIAANSALCPLVLGKWPLFVEGKVEDMAIGQLRIATSVWIGKLPVDAGLGETVEDFKREPERFAFNFYNPVYLNRPPQDVKRWYRAISRDPEVRTFVRRIHRHLSRYYARCLKWIKSLDSYRLPERKDIKAGGGNCANPGSAFSDSTRTSPPDTGRETPDGQHGVEPADGGGGRTGREGGDGG